MKLVYAIVRKDNEDEVVDALTEERYSVTKLSTTGGFLRKGNTTADRYGRRAGGQGDRDHQKRVRREPEDHGKHAIYVRKCHFSLYDHACSRRSRRRYDLCCGRRTLRKDMILF